MNLKASVIHFIGIEDEVANTIASWVPKDKLVPLEYNFEDFTCTNIEPVKIILCGLYTSNLSVIETCQGLRMSFPESIVILVTKSPIPVYKKDLLKNGCNEVFYLPLEENLLEETINNALESFNQYSNLVPVKVNDLLALNNTSFNSFVYLPANNRYVPFNVTGIPLDSNKLEKLKQGEISTIYIKHSDLPLFYSIYSESIKKIQKTPQLSETEKRELLKNVCRELISELFTDQVSGMNNAVKLNDACKLIIQSYLQTQTSSKHWMDKFQSTLSDKRDFYTKTSNCMTASVLLAIALGVETKNIESLATAALLHDIGISQLPGYLANLPVDQMTPEEFEIYSQHPIRSIDIIKNKKVTITDLCEKIILQQHERFDGNGYPYKLQGFQICKEAQILHFVNELLNKTIMMAKKTKITFKAAFEELRTDYINNPSCVLIDPQLLQDVSHLLKEKSENNEVSSGKWKMQS